MKTEIITKLAKLIFIATFLSLTISVATSFAADCYFVDNTDPGGGGLAEEQIWENSDNWSSSSGGDPSTNPCADADGWPDSDDHAIFDGNFSANTIIPAGYSLTRLTISSANGGFTHYVEAKNNVSILGTYWDGAISQSSGTFVLDNNATVTLHGDYYQSGTGTFTARTGSTFVLGANQPMVFSDSVDNAFTFENLTINRGSSGTYQYVDQDSDDDWTVNGTLTLTDGIVRNGTITTTGGMAVASTMSGGTSLITLGGTSDSSFTIADGAVLPPFTINNSHVDTVVETAGSVTFEGAFTLTDGAFQNTADGNLTFSSSFTINGNELFDAGSPTTITHSSTINITNGEYRVGASGDEAGTMTVWGTATVSGGELDIQYLDLMNLYNSTTSLDFNSGTIHGPDTGNKMDFRADVDMTGTGTYTDHGGTWEFTGNWSYQTELYLPGGALTISNLNLNIEAARLEQWRIDSGDVLTVTNSLNLQQGYLYGDSDGKIIADGTCTVTVGSDALWLGGDGMLELQTSTNFTIPAGGNMPDTTINDPNLIVTTAGGVDFTDDFRIYDGKFDNNTASSTVAVSGGFQMTGGDFDAGTSTSFSVSGDSNFNGGSFNGETVTTINFYGHVNINGGSLDTSGSTNVYMRAYTGSLDFNSGSFSAPTRLFIWDDLDFTGTGTFTHNDGAIQFLTSGWHGNLTPGGKTFGTIEVYKGTGAGYFFDLHDDVVLAGDLILYNGRLRTNSNNDITIGGDFAMCPSLRGAANDTTCNGITPGSAYYIQDNSSTTYFNGTNQTIYGDNTTTFANFNKTVSSGTDTLTFEASKTQRITGTLTLQGVSESERLSIRSTVADTQAILNATGSYDIDYVDVKDNNSSGQGIFVAGTGSADSGNNTNWDLGGSVTGLTFNSTSGNYEYKDDLNVSYGIDTYTHGRTIWKLNGSSLLSRYLPFDGNNASSGSSAYDLAGAGANNGTLMDGVSWSATSGHDGRGAYTFDGSNDHIYMNAWNPTTEMSIGTHFKTSDRDKVQIIVDHTYATGYMMALNATNSECGSGGQICFMVRLGSTYYGAYFPVTDITNDTWYHLTGTFDGTDVKIYLNGTLKDTTSTPGGTIVTNPDRTCIGEGLGSFSCTAGANFQGSLDEMMFFDFGLTQAEVTSLYTNGLDTLFRDGGEIFPTNTVEACVTAYNSGTGGRETESCTGTQTITWDGVSGQQLTSTSGHFVNEDDITADYSINNGTHGIVNWFKNNTSITTLLMPFDGENGDEESTASDFSGNDNTGTISSNVAWISSGGHNGGGYYEFFEGSNDRITITDHDSLDEYDEMTISLWIDADTGMSSWNGIVCKADSDSGGAAGNVYSLSRASSGDDRIRMLVYNSSGAGDAFYTPDTLTSAYSSGWTHLVFTWDGATKSAQFYRNGVANGSAQTGTNVSQIRNGTDNLWIGDCYSTATSFDGKIDDVMIFDSALTAEQVASMYTNDLDTIVSEELTVGDNWKAEIYAFDNSTSGAQSPGEETGDEDILDDPPPVVAVPEFSTWLLLLTMLGGIALIIRKNPQIIPTIN